MSAIHGVNYGRPTLDLNFAKNKSLIDTVSGLNLITFSRSSTATYVGADGLIKSAAVNEPRFDHNPTTGESLGLLVEEARTNYRLNSAISSSTYGSYLSKATIVAANAIAPDGTASAISIANNTGADDNYCWGSFNDYVSIPTTGFLCASLFVKMISGTQISVKGDVSNQGWVGFAGININFATSTPTVTLLGASGQNAIAGAVIPYGNGWWRAWFVVNTADGFNSGITKGPGVVPYYAGTSAYIWGAQIEAGSFPTSYIPTTGSTVTRSADSASITGTNFSSWWNPNSSTYYASVFSRATSKDNVAILGINGSDPERQFQFSMNGGSVNSVQISTRVGSVFYLSLVSTTSLGVPIKAAGIINGTEIKISVNGTLGNSASPPRIASSIPTTMDIGRFLADSQYSLNGTINRLTYYPTRLQDFQLQQLTK